jgi:hypothetical protein
MTDVILKVVATVAILVAVLWIMKQVRALPKAPE